MSPPNLLVSNRRSGFPRVSGDEPDTFLKECADQAFSPRERG